MKAEVEPLPTTKSPIVTPVTGSEKVAVTVNAAFVGSGAPVVRTTEGAQVSIVNEDTEMVLLIFVAASVTVIVQAGYVPSARELKVIVLSPTIAPVLALEHPPAYPIVPASFEENE